MVFGCMIMVDVVLIIGIKPIHILQNGLKDLDKIIDPRPTKVVIILKRLMIKYHIDGEEEQATVHQ